MFKQRLAAGGTTIAIVLALLGGGAAAAQAEALPIENASGTVGSTAELGSGAMTSMASVTGSGTQASGGHGPRTQQDRFARVGGGDLPVRGGGTYRVTVTLDQARASESATGASAIARGYLGVEVYSCCFAGEATLIGGGQTELSSSPGSVAFTTDVYTAQDTRLNVEATLHSFASIISDDVGAASVDASADATSIDVTRVDQPDPDPAPPPVPPKRFCLLFLCL